MAKKKNEEGGDDVEAKKAKAAEAIQSMLEHAQKALGDQVSLASDLAEKSWGLPSDHLAYRWLTDNVCFPMSRIVGIAGMKESCKSAYASTIAKHFMDVGGMCVYVDTENKKSADLYEAIVGKENLNRTLDYKAFSTEQWQEEVLDAVNRVSEKYSDIPLAVIVDSLGGVDTAETSARIDKEGGVNPRNTGGMIKCKSHNEFFRYINKHLYMRPYCLLYINHLSDDPNSPIQGAKRKPGGTGQDYHAVMDLWFSVVKGTPSEKVVRGFKERLLKITTAKNSMGTSKRSIEIPYRWSHHPITGVFERCWFDWDAATAMLLADDSPSGIKNRLKPIINVTCNANKYSCKELGLVAVTDTEMGEAIRANVELRERISDALGVNRMKVWAGLKVAKDVYETRKYSVIPDPNELQNQETASE
jgi:RecA/RadA recombinase